mgnify:CR=1 FL=1
MHNDMIVMKPRGIILSSALLIVGAMAVGPTGANAVPSMLNLPDTAQIIGYAGKFGEDSDYTIHPPAYADNGDGTISDRVTGLMWQQTDGGEMTWESATNYAGTNGLGSYADWRLPTAHELFSLVEQSGGIPALGRRPYLAAG